MISGQLPPQKAIRMDWLSRDSFYDQILSIIRLSLLSLWSLCSQVQLFFLIIYQETKKLKDKSIIKYDHHGYSFYRE